MRLRFYQPDMDFDALASWVGDRRTHALWCADRFPWPLTREGLHAMLAQNAAQWGDRAYTLIDDAGRPVGFLCASVNEENVGFVKFVISASRGRGVGTQMMRLALREAFAQADSVLLNVFDINAAARRCYEKLGFAVEAEEPGAFRFGEEEWGRVRMRFARS